MIFDAGYLANFEMKLENVQDTIWLDKFLKDLYRGAKVTKTLKVIDKIFLVKLKDCVMAGQEVYSCTVTEYAQKDGWSQGSYAAGLEFFVDLYK